MADNQIVVELILDDGQILKALGRVKNEAKDVKNDLEKDSGGGFLSKGIGEITVGFAALAIAAKQTFDVLKAGFTASVGAAREGQKAIDDLSASLAVNGKFTQESVNSFTKFADALERQTGVNDDIITQNASLLASLGHLSGEGLEKATKAALDLSAATGRDATAGFRALALAAEGNTTGLSKLGIKIDDSLPKAQKLALAIEQIGLKFGGLAAARAEGFEGSLNKFGNAVEDILKTFGNLVVKSPMVVALIKFLTEELGKLGDKIQTAFSGRDPLGPFIKRALEMAQVFTQYVLPALEMTVNAGIVFFKDFLAGLNAIAALAGMAAQGVVMLLQTIGVELDTKLISKINNFTEKSTENFQTMALSAEESAQRVTETPLSAYLDELTMKLQTVASQSQTTSSTYLASLSAMNAGSQETLQQTMSVGDGFGAVMDGMNQKALELANNASKNFRAMGAQMFQALGVGAANAFASFGKALVKGENALQAFLDSMLAAIGAAMIQMGAGFILQGIAYTWAGMPNGPSLIAAGAALAAFGGILTAIGGANSAGGVSGGGGGGLSGDTGSGSMTSQFEDPQARAKPETQVQVVVQGNVFDSAETGMRISEIIRESFDLNGTKLVVG